MQFQFFSVIRVIYAIMILSLGAHGALAQDKKADEAQFQNFLKAYKELAAKYPYAADQFKIIDGKTRADLPACPGQMVCCTRFKWPHCDSWGCCDEIH